MDTPKRLFHYTTGVKLPHIQSDGFLKTTPTEPKLGERPVVWLSANERYEQTARKHLMNGNGQGMHLGSLEEMHEYTGGVYRFVYDYSVFPEDLTPIPWIALKHKARMKKKIVDTLVKRAKGVGAKPREWFGVMGRLPVKVATLERLDLKTGQWEEVSLNAAARRGTEYKVKQILDSQVTKDQRSTDTDWVD